MNTVKVATIGFTKSTAEHFFERLRNAGVKKVVDVRLNNKSQLAGFAKSADLAYFLRSIAGIQYVHLPLLAPTEPMLTAYKKEKGDWSLYEHRFMGLMAERKIECKFKAESFDETCLLCSEDKPHHCHRRLVCDYLNKHWGGVMKVQHL